MSQARTCRVLHEEISRGQVSDGRSCVGATLRIRSYWAMAVWLAIRNRRRFKYFISPRLTASSLRSWLRKRYGIPERDFGADFANLTSNFVRIVDKYIGFGVQKLGNVTVVR